MNIALKSIGEILGVNDFMYRLAFVEIDDELARKQLQPNTNSLLWLLGHVATNRGYIGTLCGHEIKSPWGEQFDKSIDQLEARDFPKLGEVRKYWAETAPLTMTKLAQMDDARLQAAPPIKFPTQDQSVLAGISFMTMHESYHIGQISSLRKQLGIESLYELAVKEMKKRRESLPNAKS